MHLPEYRIPKPSGDNHRRFERMVRDLFCKEHRALLTLLGRRGQGQAGVDIIGSCPVSNNQAERWGIQCAVREKTIEPGKILSDLTAADKKYPAQIRLQDGTIQANPRRLQALFFATSADRDAKMQDAMEGFSAGRHERGESRLQILFWDDIEELLFKHQSVYAWYYPDVFTFAVEWHSRYRAQAALELSFRGQSLRRHRLLDRNAITHDQTEFADFVREVEYLVEARARMGYSSESSDILTDLVASLERPGSPLPDPTCFADRQAFDQWLYKVAGEQAPTEKSFMDVGFLLADCASTFGSKHGHERRDHILSAATQCSPKDGIRLYNLVQRLNFQFPNCDDVDHAMSWSHRFFIEWSASLFEQAADAFTRLPSITGSDNAVSAGSPAEAL